jgi:hypothetical protein
VLDSTTEELVRPGAEGWSLCNGFGLIFLGWRFVGAENGSRATRQRAKTHAVHDIDYTLLQYNIFAVRWLMPKVVTRSAALTAWLAALIALE